MSRLNQSTFEALVASNVAEERADELKLLEADLPRWEATLRSLLADTEESIAAIARSNRDERDQALTDLTEERDRLIEALRRFGPVDHYYDDEFEFEFGYEDYEPPEEQDDEPVDDVVRLHASWTNDRIVLWAGSPAGGSAGHLILEQLVDQAGGSSIGWVEHKGPSLPANGRSAAVAAPLTEALGWLVGVGAGTLALEAGPSVHWLGEIAAWATELVAQGRMVPTLKRVGSKSSSKRKSATSYAVEWVPAAIDRGHLRQLASHLPGPVRAFDRSASPERLCRAVLAAGVDAVCRAGAGRLVTAATPPVARSRRDLSEAVLAGLDGTPFAATPTQAMQMAEDLRQWAAPVVGDREIRLSVHLDPPEADGGWLLGVGVALGSGRKPQPLERTLKSVGGAKAQQIEGELHRLGRLVPALSRTGRRGQVVLGPNEAWDIMTGIGPVLVAAGFDVRVPAASTKRVSPRLRLEADPSSGPAAVGAHQLAKVRWSVLFDDVELDAAAIAALANQARPLVETRGRWVELDRADIAAAAEAMAAHAATTELSGAAILRHAVGLEENSLAGPVVVDGAGWAVDLVRGATSDPPLPLGSPDGFVGDLRHYQADARGWLAFLDRVGLGGILAMDMGLGKTPTMLAQILDTRGQGPVLVIAPPAVLGNWAVEAARFTPDLRVQVHHGPNRPSADDLPKVVADADLVLTTYATAVRDVEALAGIEWHRMVLDEAQAIKNPASEAAGELRRISARSRLALTGTPVENGLGDLWAILDFVNPGLVGPRPAFVNQLSKTNGKGSAPGEAALRALNGLLVFRRTKAEPEIAAELPDKIDELDHCGMTQEQIGLYQAVLDNLLGTTLDPDEDKASRTGHVLAAITALKQICDHPAAYLTDDKGPLAGRSGKLARLEELVDTVYAAGERMLIFTHFARWGERLAEHLSARNELPVACYHGGLSRGVRDRIIREFQEGTGPGALVLSIKAGGSGLNLTAANHVVLYDRWWNPAVEDQARDRAWRIGQVNTVVSHRLVCPGTVDEQVEEVVAGKRRIADMVLPASSSVADLTPDQLRSALGLRPDAVIDETADLAMETLA